MLQGAIIQIDVERDIDAPLADVFARVIDIPGYSSWLPEESESRGGKLTSSGPVGVGTTYIDDTKHGPEPGEVVELEEPTRVVFRQRFSKLGLTLEEKLHTYVLEATNGGTRVRYSFNWKMRGPLRLLERFGARVATKERNIVFDALKASFEQ